MTNYKIRYRPELKSLDSVTPQEAQDLVADHNANLADNPQYKIILPQYMFKPTFGFPRNQPLGLLKALGRNIYASSVFKHIKDIIIDTEWEIVPREEGLELTDDLRTKQKEFTLFFERPNPEETYCTFARKVLDDVFKYDSGIINKVFGKLGHLIQLRAAPGDTFKKNPDKHGYLDSRDDIIRDKGVRAGKTVDSQDFNRAAFSFNNDFIERAAYFQFVSNVASQIPIPFGKKEICWLTSNPSTDNVYTNGSPLDDSIDIILTLVYGSKFNLDFYANGNTPEGIINATGATKKDINKVKQQLALSMDSPRDEFGLKRRIGYRMPVVSFDNLEFLKLNLSSQEMEILNQQQWFTKILWMRFGVNADSLGFTENSNRATGVQQDKNKIRNAVRPFYKLFEECFTYDVLTEFEDGELFKFQYKFDDITEQKLLRELQKLEIDMGISSWQEIAEADGKDLKKLKEEKEENLSFEIDNFVANGNSIPNENPEASKQEKNLQKEIEKPEKKSFTADIGGEGTTDKVMNPIQEPRKPEILGSIVKRGDEWCVTNRDKTETLGCHATRDEALDQLRAIEVSKKNKAKGYKADTIDDNEDIITLEGQDKMVEELKGHPGIKVDVSTDQEHTHIVYENDVVSSFDDEHRHDIDWDNMLLKTANKDGGTPHTHKLSEPSLDLKSKKEEKETKKLSKKTPLEIAFEPFLKEFDKKVREVEKSVEE